MSNSKNEKWAGDHQRAILIGHIGISLTCKGYELVIDLMKFVRHRAKLAAPHLSISLDSIIRYQRKERS